MNGGPGWPWFFRWGPYALLTLGALVSAATAHALLPAGEVYAAVALTACALAWQVIWDRKLRELPEPSPGRAAYFFVRTVLAFALSLLNPFFSIYALMGYFDAGRQLSKAQRRWGLLATATTLAGSQSSVPDGPPPSSASQWGVFAVLLVLHASLALILDRFNDQAAEDQRKQRITIEELEKALAENKTLQTQLLVQAREAGRADERQRLAADIHDTLAQGLAGIVTQLQASLDSAEHHTARAHVERAAALARYSLGEARRSMHNLIPGPLEHRTLAEALQETATRWSATSTTHLELTVTGTDEPLHEEIEAALLRITEEALSNVTKHADARRVGITLSYFDDEVTLDVRDDGRGFTPHELPRRTTRSGFGLEGIRARAQRVAGTIEIESEPGGGTALAVRVPLIRHDS